MRNKDAIQDLQVSRDNHARKFDTVTETLDRQDQELKELRKIVNQLIEDNIALRRSLGVAVDVSDGRPIKLKAYRGNKSSEDE